MDTYYTQETLPVYYKHGDEQVLVGDDGHFYNSNGERVYYWVSSGETAEGGRHEAYLHGQQTGEDHFSRAVSAYVQEGGSGFYTEKEIKDAFHADEGMGKLSSQTSWDNYWGYLQEQQGLIETGQLSTALDAWHRDSRQAQKDVLQAGGGLRAMGGAKGGALGQIRDEGYRNSFNEILNSELQQGLMQKWGIPTEVQTDNGSLYRFNGSTLTKVYEPESFNLASTAAQLGVGVALSAALGPVVGAKIGALTGAAPAGFVGPLSTSQVVGGKVAAGLAAGATSAGTQLLTTGDIDPRSVLTSAVMSGVNPGGYVADNYTPWRKTDLWTGDKSWAFGGAPPSSFMGGLVSGTVNDLVSNGIINGEIDLQGSLEKGLISGGINSVLNGYDEYRKNSEENLADEYQFNNPSATREEALAWANSPINADRLNKTDLGALIGENGLLDFVPQLDTSGIRNTFDFIGNGVDGLLNGFELGDYMVLPDNTRIPMEGMTDAEYTNYTENMGGQVVSTSTMGLINNPVVNGATSLLGNLLPSGSGEPSDDLQAQWDQFSQEWYDNNAGNSDLIDSNGNPTVAGAVDKNQYVTTKIDNYDAFYYSNSGGLNENYSWSPNPRGESEVWGTLDGIDGLYSTGGIPIWPMVGAGNSTISPILDADGNVTKPLNFGPEFTAPDYVQPGYTIDSVLPSNNDAAIRNWNLINFVQTLSGDDNDDKAAIADNTNNQSTTTGGNAGGEVTPDISDTSTSSSSSSTADTSSSTSDTSSSTASSSASDTSSSTSDTASSTTDTLAGSDTVSGDDDLAANQGWTITNSVDTAATGTEDVLTGGGSNLPAGGPNGEIDFTGNDGLPPLWTELYGYSKISPYKKARLKVLEGMLGGMMGGGVGNFNDFQFGANKDPYQKIKKSLYEAGITA